MGCCAGRLDRRLAFALTGFTTEATATNNPQSERAHDRLVAAFPPDPQRAVTDLVVVRSARLSVNDAGFRSFVDGLVRSIRDTGGVRSAVTYYESTDRALVSADRHAMLVRLNIPDSNDAGAVIDAVRRADADPGFMVAITGNSTRDHDFNALSERDLRNGELRFGIPAALIILLLVFGTLIAGLVPLLMAIVAITTALGLVALLDPAGRTVDLHHQHAHGYGPRARDRLRAVRISRYREERGHGRAPDDAIVAAGATASRAVLFSGSAFVIAMFGLLLVPHRSSAAWPPGRSWSGSLPSRSRSRCCPRCSACSTTGSMPAAYRSSAGARWNRTTRKDGSGERSSTGCCAARTQPGHRDRRAARPRAARPRAQHRHVGGQHAAQRPGRETGLPRAATRLRRANGRPGPRARRRRNRARLPPALQQLRDQLDADPRFGPGQIRTGIGGIDDLTVPCVATPPASRPSQRCATCASTSSRRHSTAPRRPARRRIDLGDRRLPRQRDQPGAARVRVRPGPVFLLLTIAFRSITVALTAIVLNLLSVGAAYGLLVLVFQHGVGAGVLGFQTVDAVEAWVPLFLFAVLFGLSMDYQVFLLSRIRERYDQNADTAAAVRWGVASTARIITGAALIIVAVFAGFAAGDLVMFQQMGFGIAVSLLIDATIIRSVVLPSAMVLLGDRNWYLPTWLTWLPHLEVEGHLDTEAQPHPA